ncbi:hypothetical protein ABK040_009163 [Willaertia magna]
MEAKQVVLNFLNKAYEFYPDYVKNFSFEYGETPLSHWSIPLIACSVYLIVIYSLRAVVGKPTPEDRNAPKKEKKGLDFITVFAFFHNAFLCILSLCMATGATVDAIKLSAENDFSISSVVCDPTGITTKGPINFWTWIFYLSKFYELIDTVLMVIKKRPLTFLHVYHHVITLILVYIGLMDKMSLQWIAVLTNGGIHVIMYYYFALTTLSINVWWKKYITQIQILQFVLDLIIPQIYLYYIYIAEMKCYGSVSVMWFGEGVIFSFLLLFIQFYMDTYKKAGNRKKQD